ncbi:MAG: CBM20 domain-containing protein [Nostoc sp.]
MGESICLVGSTPELGLWDIRKCVQLRTSGDRYPLWWTDTEIDIQPSLESDNGQKVEYKYVRLTATRSLPIGKNYKLHCKIRLD